MVDLSILIPSRNEEWLQRTLQDIEENKRGNTEILWEEDTEPIGQRALTNKLARKAQGKYIMKVDAHCSFSKGFDVDMMNDMEDNRVLIPAMLNLYAFDWVCENGHRTHQDALQSTKSQKTIHCPVCESDCHKEAVWQPKANSPMTHGGFDSNAVFQWFEPQPTKLKHQTMCIQGAGFMVTKENFFKWNLCDEKFGSWGSHGIEISIKTWNNGGEVWATRNAWMAHLYRRFEEFPYERDMKQVENANKMAQAMLTKNVRWIVEKFAQLKESDDEVTLLPFDWTEEKLDALS